MNNILNILNRKKLQFFYLFYTLLVLPLLSPIAENITFMDALAILVVNCILCASISVVCLFWSSRVEKIIYSVLLVTTILPGAILLSYLLFAHVLLEQNSITSLFETNTNESKEFVADYLNPWIVIGMSIYIFIPVVMIWKMRAFEALKIQKNKLLFALSFACIVSIVSIPNLSKSVYFLNFYRTFVSYKIRLAYEEKEIAARQSIPYEVTNVNNDSIPQTIVVVIGESLTRHHLQLYGYGRTTNPLLSQKGDSLTVYSDVVSPQVHTIPVIRSIMTFSEVDHTNYFVEKPSLFELFNRANYDTYFISNQAFGGKKKSSFDVLLNLAKYKFDLTPQKEHDEVVLTKLNEILSNVNTKNELIIIHLIGNHMAYKFRYPEQFKIFDNNVDNFTPTTPFRNAQAKQMIDEYDNSVAYNDYVINEIINSLSKKTNGNTAMIYLSDHGEEMYDTRDFAGHAYEKLSRPMCEIPFILWMSESFKENRRDLKLDASRPFSSVDFLYSLSNLAAIQYKDYDASRSIFSDQFEVRERYVGELKYSELKK